MATKDGGKLFHAIVLMGVALTGGVAGGACGGTTGGGGGGDGAAEDAADGSYAHISFNGDAGFPPDSYPQIGFPNTDSSAPQPDSGTMDAPTDTGPDCYPCIAPNLDAGVANG